MDEEYVLNENELLPLFNDKVFHDMFNYNDMKTIEWLAMMILDKTYEEIHGHVKVYKRKLFNINKEDSRKFVDLVVSLDNDITVIEINNHFHHNYLRNVLYIMNNINNSYIVKENDYSKKIKGVIVNINWDKIPSKSKQEINYKYPVSECKHNEFLLKIININLNYNSDASLEYSSLDKLSKLLTISSKQELIDFVEKERLLSDYYDKMDRLLKSREYCYWCGLIELTKT